MKPGNKDTAPEYISEVSACYLAPAPVHTQRQSAFSGKAYAIGQDVAKSLGTEKTVGKTQTAIPNLLKVLRSLW